MFPSALVEELSRDLELDTAVYLDEFASNNTSASKCFRPISRLKSGHLPIETGSQNTNHIGYPSIENAFNAYFMKFCQPAVGFFDDFEQRTLNELCFTKEDIRAVLSHTSIGKSFDKIPGDFLWIAPDSLTYNVMKLFQSIAETSIYPNLWKQEMIITTFETSSKFYIKSYCPINNSNKLSLVFERIIFILYVLLTEREYLVSSDIRKVIISYQLQAFSSCL